MTTYTVKVFKDRTEWCNELGEYHRTDGPAIESADGSKYWHLNGKKHRTDGPAIEYVDGTKCWYFNGLLHRTDGPAIEDANGYKEWYLNGKYLTQSEFESRTKPCKGKKVYVDGVEYTLA